MQKVIITRRPAARTLVARKPAARGLRGLGQYYPNTPTAPSLPACASPAMAQSIPQGVLIAGGGLATLVGVIGAIFSDQYREDFAIAAGVGLVSSFIGGIWAASSIATAYNQCGGADGLTAMPGAPTVPAMPTPQPVMS